MFIGSPTYYSCPKIKLITMYAYDLFFGNFSSLKFSKKSANYLNALNMYETNANQVTDPISKLIRCAITMKDCEYSKILKIEHILLTTLTIKKPVKVTQ